MLGSYSSHPSGYTISRAILSDAIALTRGDRFFTHDFTPFNLTAWGFTDCQRDPNAFGFGSMLGKLFLRTLPNNFTDNSIYTFFPLMTPEAMKLVLTKMDLLDQYDLARPKPKSATATVTGHANVSAALKNKDGLAKPCAERVARVVHGKGFFPAESEKEQQAIVSVLSSPELISGIGKFFYENTKKLVEANSYGLVGKKTFGVDLVRDVLKTVPVYWAATDLAGIKLKTSDQSGDYTASELSDVLGEIYDFIFLNVEASKVMVLQEKVKKHVKHLTELISDSLDGDVGSKIVSRLVGSLSKPKKSEHHDIINRLYELGHSNDQLANTLLALLVVSGVELTIATTNVLNLFLGTAHAEKITSLCKSADGKVQLDGYIYEALRFDPIFQGTFRVATKDHNVAGTDVKKGDRVFVDVASANVDEKIFSNPGDINITRPTKDRCHPDGVFNYLGEGLTIKIISEILRAVFEYNNVRRAPGQSGLLNRFKDQSRPELNNSYLNKTQLPGPWPTSLTILFDGPRH
jgi:linoleate 10R-lipoxygenase